MPVIHNYTPETKNISRAYNEGAVMYLQSVVHKMLFSTWHTFCTITAYYITTYAKINTVNLYEYKFTVLMRAYVGI